ncbi:hypothetical protein ONS95_001465 [Cadophora gregata]|uniref:uncharacterized protein n=1 Tax=Cadophora gregata TaxID=51156 RepID=UPI0026DD3BD0|nr:uncharacterized protein ONS95_001465 [Cadophora gregata]KAK0111087.1 hypothetical protein ONS95_001465 [Cadophora gregata]
MPYLAVIQPPIPEEHKDGFLAQWPSTAAQILAIPTVLGISGGLVVGENGAPTSGFKFFETVAFATLEDEKAFADSEFAKEAAKKWAEKSGGAPLPKHTLYECDDFPTDRAPKAFTQFSQLAGVDAAKGAEVKKAWEDLAAVLGKETWGGRAVDGAGGIGLIGWDSAEEAAAAYKNPAAKAALDKYQSFGEVKDYLIKMEYSK